MNQEQPRIQSAAQASRTGQTASVGAEVGGVHSSGDSSRVDLHALSAETRAWLKALGRDSRLVVWLAMVLSSLCRSEDTRA